MSNPTELVKLLLEHDDERLYKEADLLMWAAAKEIERLQGLVRRAQPEGEAPQADGTSSLRGALMAVDGQLCAILNGADGSVYSKLKAARNDLVRIWLPLSSAPAATLSPLCGAQHAESGKDGAAIAAFKKWHEEVGDQDCEYTWLQAWTAAQSAKPTSAPGTPEAPKPPFPISDDEMAALRRFWECATDGEGYDVEKAMMQRLAEMGLVQRKSGAYYMATDFGLYVLGEYTVERAAQLDGGQEGSD